MYVSSWNDDNLHDFEQNMHKTCTKHPSSFSTSMHASPCLYHHPSPPNRVLQLFTLTSVCHNSHSSLLITCLPPGANIVLSHFNVLELAGVPSLALTIFCMTRLPFSQKHVPAILNISLFKNFGSPILCTSFLSRKGLPRQ